MAATKQESLVSPIKAYNSTLQIWSWSQYYFILFWFENYFFLLENSFISEYWTIRFILLGYSFILIFLLEDNYFILWVNYFILLGNYFILLANYFILFGFFLLLLFNFIRKLFHFHFILCDIGNYFISLGNYLILIWFWFYAFWFAYMGLKTIHCIF